MAASEAVPVSAELVARDERRWASRKFVVTALVILLATALRPFGWLEGSEWVEAVKWVSGLYMAGNVGAAAVEALARRSA